MKLKTIYPIDKITISDIQILIQFVSSEEKLQKFNADKYESIS